MGANTHTEPHKGSRRRGAGEGRTKQWGTDIRRSVEGRVMGWGTRGTQDVYCREFEGGGFGVD